MGIRTRTWIQGLLTEQPEWLVELLHEHSEGLQLEIEQLRAKNAQLTKDHERLCRRQAGRQISTCCARALREAAELIARED